ncbi:MAG TPA: GGDEF domain-containing protein, partial [Thermoleophilaceae bacterium]|nr:GGDEF domain-containing protein [Thermoleophilaceae bacterium]
MARVEDPPQTQAQAPDDVQRELRRLGSALAERSGEVIEAVASRAQQEMEREGALELDGEIEEHFARLGTLATVAVGGWVAGEPVDIASTAGGEFSRVSAQLATSRDVPLGEVVRRCRCWREACQRTLHEVAADGAVGEEALGRACKSIQRAADRALAQMSTIFDAERQRITEELADRQAELSFLATHDGLTKLANRSLVMDHLVRMLARSARHGSSVAVLFIDLDDFKLVNDTLGHAVGDRLLVAVAERLRSLVRDADTLGRLGGDEFVVLAEGPAAMSPAMIAARLAETFVETFALDGQPSPLRLSASIGVAIATSESSAQQLLCEADVAMYCAKAQGSAWGRYEPGMAAVLKGRGPRGQAENELVPTDAEAGGHGPIPSSTETSPEDDPSLGEVSVELG